MKENITPAPNATFKNMVEPAMAVDLRCFSDVKKNEINVSSQPEIHERKLVTANSLVRHRVNRLVDHH